jgi:hypothetical protein
MAARACHALHGLQGRAPAGWPPASKTEKCQHTIEERGERPGLPLSAHQIAVQERTHPRRRKLEFLFDGAQLLAAAVTDIETGNASAISGLQIGIGGSQAYFEG